MYDPEEGRIGEQMYNSLNLKQKEAVDLIIRAASTVMSPQYSISMDQVDLEKRISTPL